MRRREELGLLADQPLEQANAALALARDRSVLLLAEDLHRREREAIGLHAAALDAEALRAFGYHVQHPQLRHVPLHDPRERADRRGNRRLTHFLALHDEADAERRD